MPEQDGCYPVETIAALLNLQRRWVQQLAKNGVMPKAAHGRYPLAGCVQGYVRYLQAQAETHAPSELEQHRLALLEQRYRKLKFENDKLEDSLIPAEDAEIVCGLILEVIDQSLKVMHSRALIDSLQGMTEPAVVRHGLKEAARACRQDLFERLVRLYEDGTGKKFPHNGEPS